MHPRVSNLMKSVRLCYEGDPDALYIVEKGKDFVTTLFVFFLLVNSRTYPALTAGDRSCFPRDSSPKSRQGGLTWPWRPFQINLKISSYELLKMVPTTILLVFVITMWVAQSFIT